MAVLNVIMHILHIVVWVGPTPQRQVLAHNSVASYKCSANRTLADFDDFQWVVTIGESKLYAGQAGKF